MADDQGNGIFAPFPAPPPFYKHFTPDNLARAKQQDNEGDGPQGGGVTTKVEDGTAAGIQDEQAASREFLTPPQPPASGTWNVFGVEYNLETKIRSLEENGIERLYPEAPRGGSSAIPRKNHAQLVTHVVRSILLNFVELADILSKDPQHAANKISDLQTLFFNAHHLLNEYRPHQARETLIGMMEQRVAAMRADIDQVRTMEMRVAELISGLGDLGEDAVEVPDLKMQAEEKAQRERKDEARSLWDAMQSIELD